MVELLKLAMAKPVNAVIVVICICMGTVSSTVYNIDVALAVVQEKQKVTEGYQEKLVLMSETLVRVDTNVKILMEK